MYIIFNKDYKLKNFYLQYFHINLISRNKYEVEDDLFSLKGNIVLSNFTQARYLAKKINDIRTKEGKINELTSGGELNGLGLLHEIFHYIIRVYEEQENPGSIKRCLDFIQNGITKLELDKILSSFVNDFPPISVYKKELTAEEYLNGSQGDKTNRELILEELFLLHLENVNPAITQLQELFSDKDLNKNTKYSILLHLAEKFFVLEKPIGKENLPLLHFLRKPISASPYSLDGQLDYILTDWDIIIADEFGEKLLKGKDLIVEEGKYFLAKGFFTKGTPPVPDFSAEQKYFDELKRKLAAGILLSPSELQYYQEESERFTTDIDWMPKVVMLAKNTFVWLYQLSNKYGRHISRLDEIPDEELDRIASANFTSLWLIGLWERSNASRRIKQIMGNPEAASSAYSLYDYVIAHELGGEDAFQNLKHRCAIRGIRLASDMVPNHTGIYSKWVVEKPDYFIQSRVPPFPGYTFTGTNLSEDNRVEIRIEDKYYSKSDASVVFERRDPNTGDTRYIYHGNDGTHMPWNDTAQLNLLDPEVRESLIQTIMHVARKTSIIRFDAAMTLTKKHYQRLWFPIPGTGADIPSRSEYAMTRSAFDDAMPMEFWREVVDRINKEMPETLLLAEAFWLMESYFVRTLGMHRVYNSAFMHMMMKEENAKYRLMVRNTIQFNPEILKRYVNFMSNPDEETTVNQFGKGDKYFGVCLLLITLPGLPMFAHGQVEGLSEKYGMEYKRSYYNEYPDEFLIERHKREIFPLLRKRYLFSQVDHFEFYDFIEQSGKVNENVYAFTNRSGNEKAIVFYNNAYDETRGYINFSLQKMNNHSGYLESKKVIDALDMKGERNFYYIYKNTKTNLEHLISGRDIAEQGINIRLYGYEYAVLIDWREVYDNTGNFEHLYINLDNNGVPSIDEALKELSLAPVHKALTDLMNNPVIIGLKEYSLPFEENKTEENQIFPVNIQIKIHNLFTRIDYYDEYKINADNLLTKTKDWFCKYKEFNDLILNLKVRKTDPAWLLKAKETLIFVENDNVIHMLSILFPIILFNNFVKEVRTKGTHLDSEQVSEKFMLNKIFWEIFERIGNKFENIHNDIELLKVLISNDVVAVYEKGVLFNTNGDNGKYNSFKKLLDLNSVKSFIKLNEYEGTYYYNKENLEILLDWIQYLSIINLYVNKVDLKKLKKENIENSFTPNDFIKSLKVFKKSIDEVKDISLNSEYKYLNLISNLEKPLTKEKKLVVEKKKTPITKTSLPKEKKNNKNDKNNL